MKIRKIEPASYPKVTALLQAAFAGSRYEERLLHNLRKNRREILEWACIHKNKCVGYIAFTLAYHDKDVCGLHLAPIAVNPDYQGRGVGTELMRFALRQKEIRDTTVFVLGDPGFYSRFGFEHCAMPRCPLVTDNANFLSINNSSTAQFTVGYEPEFFQGTDCS